MLERPSQNLIEYLSYKEFSTDPDKYIEVS